MDDKRPYYKMIKTKVSYEEWKAYHKWSYANSDYNTVNIDSDVGRNPYGYRVIPIMKLGDNLLLVKRMTFWERLFG